MNGGFDPPSSCSEWADIEWMGADEHECFLVRDKLYTYWNHTKDLSPKPLNDHTTVVIVPDTPAIQATRVRKAIKTQEGV